ncbi:MAG: tripartite tricarboxylate transporter TctB family protein [Pseudomonadota bacterium]
MQPEPYSDRPTPRADLWIGVVASALGIAALALVPGEVARDGLQDFGNVRSAAFFPVISAVFLILLSAALLLRAVRAGALSPTESRMPAISFKVAAVGSALGIAGLAVFWLGFLVTTALLIAGLSFVFGERRLRVIAALAVSVPLAIQILFRETLNVLLPSGIW